MMSMSKKQLTSLVMIVLGTLAAGAFVANIGWGAVSIAPGQVVGIIFHNIGIDLGVEFSQQQHAVVSAIRLPRAIMALTVGGALALAGTILQAVFRTEVAEPTVLGVTSGSIVTVMFGIVFGLTSVGTWSLPVMGALGAFVALFFMYRLAERQRLTGSATIVLIGVAVHFVLSAVISLITFVSANPAVRDTTFWTLGGLTGVLWSQVWVAVPAVSIASVMLWRYRKALNVLALGDAVAAQLGVETRSLRLWVIVWVAVLAGTSVAFSGTIAFVGLIVPYVLRAVVGPDHRALIPSSLLGGAFIVSLGDLAARTLIAPMEIPLGILLTILGGPIFLVLLYRSGVMGGEV